ncbi:MAG: TraR/DksA C4-type zinc finger protein [Verrucomicrobium sp.]|nr:TraR/DksA C4-type zinc finger protein [Verrucomicrobium sp.]
MAKADRKKAPIKKASPKPVKAKAAAPKAKPAPKKAAPAKAKPAKAAVVKVQAAKAPAAKPAPKAKAPAKAAPAVAERAPVPIKQPYNNDFLERQKQRLLELRDHLLNQMQGVAQDTLRVRAEGSEASAFGMHQADAGSDAYDKDFALSLLSQEQDALYEIEEALKRIEGRTYGVCEMSNKAIPKVRLEAIPHARFTVECQAQLERENKGRRRWDTIPQFMDSAETLVDEEDDSSEEDDRRKEKD